MDDQIQELRSFNRFYTRQLGLLDETLLQTDFSLTEARILFEIANRTDCTASDLASEFGIDSGYLSRSIAAFEKQGLVRRIRSNQDSRERFLKLTAKGKKTFASLNEKSNLDAQTLLNKLTQENRGRLLQSMKTIWNILEPPEETAQQAVLRNHRAGDIGWITYRHGTLYADEYGFDETFEALVAEILVKFIQKHNPERERIWIAELHGERAGSVMIVDAGDNIAQLRLLLVEPWARGRKIGRLLVEECNAFAREKGYRKIRLWTQSNLFEARQLYVKTGYHLVEEKCHRSFGQDLVAEFWERTL